MHRECTASGATPCCLACGWLAQAAINAAFADDGELLFVGSSEAAQATNVYDGAAAAGMDATAGGRPGSAQRRRPDSARRSSKTGAK